MAYLLDANVFIQAKNLHYGFDFCPAFWDWIEEQNAAGSVFSIERVGDELTAGEDRLAEWAEEQGRSLYLAPDAAMLGSLPTVSTWVSSQSCSPAAVNTFLQVADYYLVARALAHAGGAASPELWRGGRMRLYDSGATTARVGKYVRYRRASRVSSVYPRTAA